MPSQPSLWQQAGPLFWITSIGTIRLHALSVRGPTFKRRLAPRERWGRDGAKVDDGGVGAPSWSAVIEWGTTVHAIANPNAVYPDDLNKFERSFLTLSETGTLYIPMVGLRRARAESYERSRGITDNGDECEITNVAWLEDNEDTQAVAQWAAPSARSTFNPLGSVMLTFSAQQALPMADSSVQISQSIDAVQELLATPGNVASDLEARARALDGQLAKLEATFTSAVDEVGRLLTNPEASVAAAYFRTVRDLTARLVSEAAANIGATSQRRYPVAVSVVQVAADAGTDPMTLLSMNPRLAATPHAIPPNTPINVPA